MTCERFDTEGAALLETGQALDPHYDACPDCRVALLSQRRIADTLADWAREDRATVVPAAWEQRLRAALARQADESASSPAPPQPVAAPKAERVRLAWPIWRWASLGAAAAAASWLWIAPLLRVPGVPRLAVLIAHGGVARRGAEAQLGGAARFEAQTGGRPVAEIRVYRGDEPRPVLVCSDRPPCARVGERLEAQLQLDAYGAYQALLLVSSRPLPAPGAGLDEDTAAARASGAEVVLLQDNAFEVR